MSILVLNHCDLDAVGCKIVLDYFGFYYDRMISINYDSLDNLEKFEKDYSILDYDKIICTDFSLPTVYVKKLLSLGKIVEIYDHHDYENNELTKDLLSIKHDNYKIVHDTAKCGTSIVAQEFKGRFRLKPIFNQFIKIVETYDLYKKKDALWVDAENCNRVLWGCINWSETDSIKKFDFICSYWLNKIHSYDNWFWSDFEQQKITRAKEIEQEAYTQAMLTYKTAIDDKGIKYGMAVAEKKISTVASLILENKKDIVYLIMFNTYHKEWGKLSLRTLEDSGFDCTQFVECQGHKEASGGSVDSELAKKIYRGIKKLTYKD